MGDNYCPLFENAAVSKFTTHPVEIQQFFLSAAASTKSSVVAHGKMLTKRKFLLLSTKNTDGVIAKLFSIPSKVSKTRKSSKQRFNNRGTTSKGERNTFFIFSV